MNSPLSEDALIRELFAPIAGPGGLALRDDAALMTPPPGHDLVLTTDAIISGVHYFPDDPPESIARKALRVNLSDLAAKGADPLGFLLTLALPDDHTRDWLERFAAALGEDAKAARIDLLGGDTVRTPGPAMISITAIGVVPFGRMVSRMGARVGDMLYVSGTIGDAAIGLRLRLGGGDIPGLSQRGRDHALARYLEPQPRNALAAAMRDFATGGMDISDGFVGDVSKMLAASGVSGQIYLNAAPISDEIRDAVRMDTALHDVAMTGGDDYELLASVPSSRVADFEAAARAAGVRVTRVGEVTPDGEKPTFFGLDGKPRSFERGSFSHF